jgi:flagellar basal body-associated protein FliL
MIGKKGKKIFVIITVIASLALLAGAVLPYLLYAH